MFLSNMKCVVSSVPEIIAIGVLGGVVRTPNLREEEALGGRRWYC